MKLKIENPEKLVGYVISFASEQPYECKQILLRNNYYHWKFEPVDGSEFPQFEVKLDKLGEDGSSVKELVMFPLSVTKWNCDLKKEGTVTKRLGWRGVDDINILLSAIEACIREIEE